MAVLGARAAAAMSVIGLLSSRSPASGRHYNDWWRAISFGSQGGDCDDTDRLPGGDELRARGGAIIVAKRLLWPISNSASDEAAIAAFAKSWRRE